MNTDYLESYQKITQDYLHPQYKYSTPEEQGAAIKKCTILEPVEIQYSSETSIDVLKK